jgi:hypothetical protein
MNAQNPLVKFAAFMDAAENIVVRDFAKLITKNTEGVEIHFSERLTLLVEIC